MGALTLVARWRRTRPSGLLKIIGDAREYGRDSRFPIVWRNSHPRTGDAAQEVGDLDPHYFHQDLWAARKVFGARPTMHLDVGSRIDGFVAHVLTFMPVTVVDVRPLGLHVEDLDFVQGDGRYLASVPDRSQPSVSCLHALEHYGLGRYGDPVDREGWRKGCESLARVVAPNGRLYVSVPIGSERLEFNAHRVFDPNTIVDAVGLPLLDFAAVGADGRFQPSAELTAFRDVGYACGLFEFQG